MLSIDIFIASLGNSTIDNSVYCVWSSYYCVQRDGGMDEGRDGHGNWGSEWAWDGDRIVHRGAGLAPHSSGGGAGTTSHMGAGRVGHPGGWGGPETLYHIYIHPPCNK